MRIWLRFGYGQVLCLVVLVFFASFFPGCRRTPEELPLTPPATHPLNREYIGYGVVNISFAHFLTEPGPDGISAGYLRRGTVVRIIERRLSSPGENFESWVLAEENSPEAAASGGWLPETAVDIYDNESRAQTASGVMSQ